MPHHAAGSTAEHWLSLLIDAVDEYAIFLLDDCGNVASWNRGAERIKGYEADEVLGEHFSIFYTVEDIAAGKPERELAVAAERGSSTDEGWRVKKDGERFWATVVITALRGEEGQVLGFAKITRDETGRRIADQLTRQLELIADRERIAAGVHSTIVRKIYDAGLHIYGILKFERDPELAERMTQAIDLLDDASKDIRSLIVELETDQT